MAEVEAVASSSEVANSSAFNQIKDEILEPLKKKLRTEEKSDAKGEKLEHRLGGILSCVICIDLSPGPIFQCSNGHLMCAGCFTHLLADARLRDETATCPNCRMVISKDLCSRNLAVEKALCELPAECQFCNKELPRAQIEHHQTELCEERNCSTDSDVGTPCGTRTCRLRITCCRYSRIGCHWRGPFHEMNAHEESCVHTRKSGLEVMEALEEIDRKFQEEQQLYIRIFELLSFEKITFNDLQFKPYRTDEFIHKLYYETSRFTAFNNQWVVKAMINDNQRDPTQSCDRTLTYQLVLKSKITSPLGIHYLVLKGPFGDTKIHPRLHHHEFSDGASESIYRHLALSSSAECNKLLAAKAINFRLIMFQVSK